MHGISGNLVWLSVVNLHERPYFLDHMSFAVIVNTLASIFTSPILASLLTCQIEKNSSHIKASIGY